VSKQIEEIIITEPKVAVNKQEQATSPSNASSEADFGHNIHSLKDIILQDYQ
jgi:hypothetical protein